MKPLNDYIFESINETLIMPDYTCAEMIEESEIDFEKKTIKNLEKYLGVKFGDMYCYFAESEDDFIDADKTVSKFKKFESLMDKLDPIDSWEDEEALANLSIFKTPKNTIFAYLVNDYGDFNNIISATREIK